MKEIYKLNDSNVPTLPTPHDCVIKEVLIEKDMLTFKFEDDISNYDSIQYLNKNAKSLIIRYHLIDDFETYEFNLKSLFNKEGYQSVDNSKLIKYAAKRLEYLYTYIGYQSVILKLDASKAVIVDINCDTIEYEWIE